MKTMILRQACPTNRECDGYGRGRAITTKIIIVIKIILIKIITFIFITIILIRIIMIITRPIQPTQSMRIMVVVKPSTAAFRASPKLLIERYRCTCAQ